MGVKVEYFNLILNSKMSKNKFKIAFSALRLRLMYLTLENELFFPE